MAHLRQNRVIWTLMTLASFAALGWLAVVGQWPFAPDGGVILTDFAAVWAAGIRALSGKAELVYDLNLHESYYASLVQQPAANGLTFGYPPTALLVYAPFGLLSYGTSLLFYLVCGVGLWCCTLRSIVRDAPTALAMAFAWGGATHTILLGQNGFLTASALAGGLQMLEQRPKLSGVLFGILAVKPHLGLALGVFLLFRRDWVAIGATLITIAGMIAATVLFWGLGVWARYFQASQEIAEIVGQRANSIIAHKMQSVFASAVDHVAMATAFYIHVTVAAIAITLMILVVVRRAEFPVQMAAVIAASLMVTPYSFLYDSTVLTAAAGCLLSIKLTRGQKWVLLGVMLLPGLWFFTSEPFVPLACMSILVLCSLHPRRGLSNKEQLLAQCAAKVGHSASADRPEPR